MAEINEKKEESKSQNINELVDLRSIAIDMTLPAEERRKEFLKQIKNPYLFRYGTYIVELSFKDEGKSFMDCFHEM